MENPFNSPTTIRDPKKLIGRDDQLRQIFALLKDRQNASIVGTRRIGKTSLLTGIKDEETQRRFGFPGQNFLFFAIDLQERMLKTEKNFLEDINSVIRQQGQRYLEDEPVEESEDDEFIHLLEVVKQQGFHPVLMIDTFDMISRYKRADDDFFGFLRSLASVDRISYITASIKSVAQICPKSNDNLSSPFFNIFRKFQLGPLSEQDARELLTRFSATEGLPFSPQEVDWALEVAGYHPYFLQQVGFALFQKKSIGMVGKSDLQHMRREVYEELKDYMEDYWNAFDHDESKQLAEIALQSEQGQRAYPDLYCSGLFLDFLQGSYKPAKMSFNEMSRESFEKILDKLDDARALGESVLAHYPIISSRLPSDKIQEPIARGKAVRETFKEAFERLRAEGTREDVAPEWRLYNILYYRYFRGRHITHKQIAARLALSERQYYRALKQAIDSYWNTWQEIIAQEVLPSNGV